MGPIAVVIDAKSGHMPYPTALLEELMASGPKGRQAEPHTHIGKKKKPMRCISHGYHG